MKENYKKLSYRSEIDITTLNKEKIIEFNVIFNQEDLFQISIDLELESIKKHPLFIEWQTFPMMEKNQRFLNEISENITDKSTKIIFCFIYVFEV